jgi:hypothetical protein
MFTLSITSPSGKVYKTRPLSAREAFELFMIAHIGGANVESVKL